MDSYVSNFARCLKLHHQNLFRTKDPEKLDSFISNLTKELKALAQDSGQDKDTLRDIDVHPVLDNKEISYASEFKNTEGYLRP
jgi:hypothetical protein